jgi:serine/threonine protein phosphatase PrpC
MAPPLAFLHDPWPSACLSARGGRAENQDACAHRGADGADPTPPRLEQALQAAHQALLRHQAERPELADMRTTVVLLWRRADRALWAHVGDSRLYHFRNGTLAFQTADHSVPQMLAGAGDIDPGAIRGHPDRNRLLRALGSPGPLRPSIPRQPLRTRPGDAFLLCTDGFWEPVPERDMQADLAAAGDPDDWLRRMQARLETRVRGAHDNYTATGVWVP